MLSKRPPEDLLEGGSCRDDVEFLEEKALEYGVDWYGDAGVAPRKEAEEEGGVVS